MRIQPNPASSLRRHQRVWLVADALPACLYGAESASRALLAAHALAGHPFVARRRMDGDDPAHAALALRLPLGATLRSLAFCATPAAIGAIAPAVSLSELVVSGAAPSGWCDDLEFLDAAISATGAILRVYGSLAWQAATGDAYLRATSDLDVLVLPDSPWQARACLAIFAELAPSFVFRLDGEIEFPDGRAVAWRELLGAPCQVIVKSVDNVALARTETLWREQAWN